MANGERAFVDADFTRSLTAADWELVASHPQNYFCKAVSVTITKILGVSRGSAGVGLMGGTPRLAPNQRGSDPRLSLDHQKVANHHSLSVRSADTMDRCGGGGAFLRVRSGARSSGQP